MRIVTAIMLLCMAVPAVAQKKKATASTSELDKLCAKYKHGEAIVIYAAGGQVHANVMINYNSSGKPYSIILYGRYASNAPEPVKTVIEDLSNAKERAGYRYGGIGTVPIPIDTSDAPRSMNVRLFWKGSQYAKYGMEDKFSTDPLFDDSIFYFEVGDLKRGVKAKGATQPFTF